MSAFVKVGSEIAIELAFTQHSGKAEITVLADGRFVVIWNDNGPANYQRYIRAQIFAADGTPWGGELAIADALWGASTPTVTALAGGGFVATWDANAGPVASARVYDGDGAPLGPVFTIPVDNGAQVVALANGGFAAVGALHGAAGDPDGWSVHLHTYDATGAATSGDILVNATTANDQFAPSVAALAGGELVVTWSEYDYESDDRRTLAQIFDASGARIGGELVLTDSMRSHIWNSPVIALPNGNFAVSWGMASDPLYGGGGGTWTQIYTSAGMAVGSPIITPSFASGLSIDIAALADGSIAVAWQADDSLSDGSGEGVFVQVYGADGTPLTAALQVDADGNGDQIEPTIVARDDGGFIVTWTDRNGAGGEDDQVKVQTFGPTEAWAPVVIGSNGGNAAAALAIAENTTAVTTVAASGGEAPLTYAIFGGADMARFAIDATTGALSFVAAPNYEATFNVGSGNVYEVVVSASDGTRIDTQALSISVLNVNEFAPVIIGVGPNASVGRTENSVLVSDFDAYDSDNTPVAFSIAGGTDAAKFVIDAVTGVLQFVTAPNYEAPTSTTGYNTYYVTIAASDGVNVDTLNLNVNISDVNEALAITSLGGGETAALTISENVTAVATVAAADPELASVSYAIAGGSDAARFAIDVASGALTFVAAPDFETPGDADGDNVYDIVVSASDGTFTDSQTIAVTVRDAPLVISSLGGGDTAAVTVSENTTAVATIVAADSDQATPSYAILGGSDAALFAIDAVTGALSFVAAPNFEARSDSDGDNVYQVIVGASAGDQTDSQTIAVTVGNVNEPLTITSFGGGDTATRTISENTTDVGRVIAEDIDQTTPIFSIVGGADAARFTIGTFSGLLWFVTAPNHEAPTDAGGNNVYDVVVRASDGTFSDTQAIAVTVGNVNEAPVITSNGGGTNASVTVSENATAVTTVAASDPEGNARTYAITGGVDAARFAIDANTGALSFVAAPDYEAPADSGANNVYNVTVSASDGALIDTQALTVTVAAVNEPLAITSLGGGDTASLTLVENAIAVATVTAADPDHATPSYSIAGGADAARFAIDAATGALTFVGAPNFEAPGDANGDNVYDVIVAVGDGTFTDSQAIAITVGDANEAPVITSNGGGASAALAIVEGATAATTVVAADAEGGAVSYAIAGGADAALFSIDAATGALRFLAAPDAAAPSDVGADNVYDVTVSASDGELVTVQALAILVQPVPLFFEATQFAQWENFPESTWLAVTGAEENEPVVFAISGGADAALFQLSSEGQIYLSARDYEMRADADQDNVYEVEVTAQQGLRTATATLAFTVQDLNEAPTLVSQTEWSVNENWEFVGTLAGTDPEGDELRYFIDGGADAGLFTVDRYTGEFGFVDGADFEMPGDADGDNVYELVVGAIDGGDLGANETTATIYVTVADLDESLALAETSFHAWENDTFAAVLNVTDAAGPASYAIAGGADAAAFALDATTGELSFLSAPDFEAWADADGDNWFDVDVTATVGGATATETISVRLHNVNEAPVVSPTAAFTVNENGFAAAFVVATDVDSPSLSYHILNTADAARFTINSAGVLSFRQAPNFEAPADGNQDNVYWVLVDVYDGEFAVTQAISVAVENVDEAPVITSGGGAPSFTYNLAENTTAVATIAANDPDGGAVTYSLAGGADAPLFAIDPGTGALRFLAAPDYEAPTDANLDGRYTVVIRAGAGALADTQTITVNVTNVTSGGMTLTGTSAGDTLAGGEGADTLNGLGGNDVLNGGDGADRLIGGSSADILTGGTGADDFVFSSPADSTSGASDRIIDFSRSQGDTIDLSAIDARTAMSGNQAFTFIGTSAFSTGSGGQLRYVIQGGDTIVQGDVNGDRIADFQLIIDVPTSLTSGDFVL